MLYQSYVGMKIIRQEEQISKPRKSMTQNENKNMRIPKANEKIK